jgi:hypothetical protein
MREQAPALYDQNLNGWLACDDRSFTVRCLRPDDPGPGGTGAARAFLSDGSKVIDHLDVLVAALDGIRQAGYPVEVEECDLTGQRMHVKVRCDAVRVMAPLLMARLPLPVHRRIRRGQPVHLRLVRADDFVLTRSDLATCLASA